MITKLKKLYLKEQFNPSLLGLFINPFYFARKGLYKNISELMNNIDGDVLDIGCGQKPYENLCKCDKYIGLELDTLENRNYKKADYFYDGKSFPFENCSFDSIILNQVFEHVFNPDIFLKEINRVIKISGRFLISVPFVWSEHEQPFDFARYSSFGIKSLLERHGFEIVEYRKSVNNLGAIFQLLSDYIYKKTVTKNSYVNIIFTTLLISPVNIIGLVLSNILPKNNDLYLDNIILLKKIKNV